MGMAMILFANPIKQAQVWLQVCLSPVAFEVPHCWYGKDQIQISISSSDDSKLRAALFRVGCGNTKCRGSSFASWPDEKFGLCPWTTAQWNSPGRSCPSSAASISAGLLGVIDPEHRHLQSVNSEADCWTQHLGDADPVQLLA